MTTARRIRALLVCRIRDAQMKALVLAGTARVLPADPAKLFLQNLIKPTARNHMCEVSELCRSLFQPGEHRHTKRHLRKVLAPV